MSSEQYNDKGTKIIDEDWDVLIILDACRKDMFFESCNIDGEFDTKISRGSNTEEFLYGNFHNENLLDTVYTTSNPQLYRNYSIIEPKFNKISNIWNTNFWDEDIGTVHPHDTTTAALQNIKEYPNKRHIIHYLQPHYPFINTKIENIGHDILTNKEGDYNIWDLQMRGELNFSKEEILKAYYQNLELAFDAIEPLLSEITGKIVISSDHGNMVGERSRPIPIREWGHPSGIYTPELVEVPWLEIEKGRRPEIYTGKSAQRQEDVNNEVVKDRLKDLGYV